MLLEIAGITESNLLLLGVKAVSTESNSIYIYIYITLLQIQFIS